MRLKNLKGSPGNKYDLLEHERLGHKEETGGSFYLMANRSDTSQDQWGTVVLGEQGLIMQ